MTTLKEIIKKIKPIEFIGNENVGINEVIQLNKDNNRNDVISWCGDKNIHLLSGCIAGTIICSVMGKDYVVNGCN
jgi:hypothetical protein